MDRLTDLTTTVALQLTALDDARWRQGISEAYSVMLNRAYNALRSYGVDYTKLRTYKLWATFHPPAGPIPQEVRSKMAHWITLIEHDLEAAINRTLTHKVTDNKDPFA